MPFWEFAYADQAIFVRREALERVGGVPDVPLMEEHELFRRLEEQGTFRLVPQTVLTSSRRFVRAGLLTTYLKMACVEVGWRLGVSPVRLARWYRGK